jgi:hypothetical protein
MPMVCFRSSVAASERAGIVSLQRATLLHCNVLGEVRYLPTVLYEELPTDQWHTGWFGDRAWPVPGKLN